MLREVLAFLAIPLLVKINKFLALAPSGAATMDSGLPVVIKYTNIHVGLFAFINGLLLTLLFLFMMMNYAEIDRYNSEIAEMKATVTDYCF